VTVNAKDTDAQSVEPHTVVAATVMSAGAVMLRASRPTALAAPPENSSAADAATTKASLKSRATSAFYCATISFATGTKG
jgi:hypothetical protein